MKIIKEIHKKAAKLNSCLLFSGKENFEELISLLLSEQGIEFCLKNNFPELNYFEQFDRQELEKRGVYVNSGIVELENKKQVLLVGNTDAILKYDKVNHAYKVTVMHGATADIEAEGYAVVFTNGVLDSFNIKTSNNAIVK